MPLYFLDLIENRQ